ncbi:MAG TPA: helix-turn-helix transcriptional regulator [Candidatus Limnocylindrales bacterium]
MANSTGLDGATSAAAGRGDGTTAPTRQSGTTAPTRQSGTTPPTRQRELAADIGRRIRQARLAAGLTQAQLAAPRYTKAYISALETGMSRPSMLALSFIAGRLGLPVRRFLEDEPADWGRLAADMELAGGHWQAAADAYTALLEAEGDGEARAELLLGLAEAEAGLDHGAAAVAAAAEASHRFAAAQRPEQGALADYWLACGEYQQGNSAEATSLLRAVLERLRAGLRVEPDFQARILMALSSTASQDGEHEVALAYLEEVRDLVEDLDARRRGVYLFDLAHSYRETGDYEAAVRAALAGLGFLRAAGLEHEWAGLLNGLARSYLAIGQPGRAREAIAEARATFVRLRDTRWLAYVAEAEAEVHLAEGDPDGTERLAGEALALAEQAGDQKGMVEASLVLARARRGEGPTPEVLGRYERAAELAERWGRPARLREVLAEYADLLADAGEHERAFEMMRRAVRGT